MGTLGARVQRPPRELDDFCRLDWPRLVGALTLYTGDPLLAEDITQDALIRVASRWEHVSRLDAPGAWAYRVALNVARSHFRRLRVARRHRLAVATSATASDADLAEAIAVRSAVSALPERQRRALVLRYWCDLSVDETARLMQCPPNTVKTLTRRAVLALRGSDLVPDLPEVLRVD